MHYQYQNRDYLFYGDHKPRHGPGQIMNSMMTQIILGCSKKLILDEGQLNTYQNCLHNGHLLKALRYILNNLTIYIYEVEVKRLI